MTYVYEVRYYSQNGQYIEEPYELLREASRRKRDLVSEGIDEDECEIYRVEKQSERPRR